MIAGGCRGAAAVKWMCENTLPELLTQSCSLRRRKAVALELFNPLKVHGAWPESLTTESHIDSRCDGGKDP